MGAMLLPVVPVLIVVLTGAVSLAVDRTRRGPDEPAAVGVPAIGLAAAFVASVLLWMRGPDASGVVEIDAYASFFNILFCTLGLFSVGTSAASHRRVRAHDERGRDGMLLWSLAGMMAAAAARDLIVAVLALAVAWGAGVVLMGLRRDRDAGMEVAFKALILGAFAWALWLYGVALAYAVTGATRLDVLAARIAASSLEPNILLFVALVLILGGIGFMVSAVPFHAWMADACSGTDAATAGFLSTGLRLAGSAVFLRVFLTAFESLRIDWLPLLSAVAGVTMIVGALAAVGQSSVRRLVAHVGVAHAGYLIVGVLAASQAGKAAMVFALVVWGAANAGVFAMLLVVSTAGHRHDDVRDFTGLGYERPAAAALITICLLSLAGLPPTAGFAARWLLLGAALQEGLVAMAVLGALTSVVLTFACLRLVVQMYMTAAHGPRRRAPVPRRALVGAVVVAAGIVWAGAWPGPLLAAAIRSVAAVF